jgi:triacylglycerol esterase/lipase EstA (alpha/beta hydrolase family)
MSSIVAVHGLNPRSKNDRDHAWDTWRKPSGFRGRLWLRDDLPQHVPETRIFLYEYNSTAVYGKDRDTFIGKANELLEAIRIERDDMESRPILLLGHSMGGLLIKQALINAHNNPKYTPIKDATTGLAFFATPHNGGDRMLVSLGGMVAKIATALGFQKGDDVLETLKSGSIFSEIMQQHWRHQLLKYEFISFWGAVDEVILGL